MTARAALRCRDCEWRDSVTSSAGLGRALSLAWPLGIEHAWHRFGHVVETKVGGRVRSTQAFRRRGGQ